MKSLLILGHPKGCTTQTVTLCHSLLGFPTTGEVLNKKGRHPYFRKDDEFYQKATQWLLRVSQDHIVKDVIQPYACDRFLRDHPEAFNVIFIDRSVEDVHISARLAGWIGQKPEGWKKNLERAKSIRDLFERFPKITYEELVFETAPLHNLLRSLGYTVTDCNYITPAFARKRDATYRKLKAFKDARKSIFDP